MTPRQISHKKRMSSGISTVIQWVSSLAVGVSVAILIVCAFLWANRTDHFQLEGIRVTGNRYLGREEIIERIELPRYPSLDELDLVIIQNKLEGHPFIKACRVSREFPSVLHIDIIEREPLAYINHSPLYLVDDEGVILPSKAGQYEFDVPTLSGFNPASELYPIGEKSLSQKVLEAVDILSEIHDFFPSLYNDLSEITIDARDEYVLRLAKSPTKIFLGADNVPMQVTLLHYFEETLAGIRSLYDFQYVDLRYKKQIVAREKV